MKRPRIKIPLDTNDKVMEILGIISLFLLIAIPSMYYNDLPDSIPSHFGPDGKPDAYGSKNSIWLLPMIGSIVYLSMFWLNKFPHIFNYPRKVTQENALSLYTAATKLMRTLNMFIAIIFAYITHSTIQTALGNQNGLGPWFLVIVIGSIFGMTGYYLYKSLKD